MGCTPHASFTVDSMLAGTMGGCCAGLYMTGDIDCVPAAVYRRQQYSEQLRAELASREACHHRAGAALARAHLHLSGIAARARNAYSRERLQQDFRDGLADVSAARMHACTCNEAARCGGERCPVDGVMHVECMHACRWRVQRMRTSAARFPAASSGSSGGRGGRGWEVLAAAVQEDRCSGLPPPPLPPPPVR